MCLLDFSKGYGRQLPPEGKTVTFLEPVWSIRPGVLSKIGDIIATLSLSADRGKQQIPPLRCAPVGMTDLYE
jgi:hypothetical protein